MDVLGGVMLLVLYGVPLVILGGVVYWAVRLGVRDGMRSAQRPGGDQP